MLELKMAPLIRVGPREPLPLGTMADGLCRRVDHVPQEQDRSALDVADEVNKGTIDEQRMLNRSDQGLRPRSLPGGGVAVNLQGRYRNMAVATVGAGGPQLKLLSKRGPIQLLRLPRHFKHDESEQH